MTGAGGRMHTIRQLGYLLQRFRILLSRTAKIVRHSSFSPIRGSRAFALFKIAE